ncbi:hypothetical protein M378DRAFT_163277, partial [Amanita muscaria Koide BX008]
MDGARIDVCAKNPGLHVERAYTKHMLRALSDFLARELKRLNNWKWRNRCRVCTRRGYRGPTKKAALRAINIS